MSEEIMPGTSMSDDQGLDTSMSNSSESTPTPAAPSFPTREIADAVRDGLKSSLTEIQQRQQEQVQNQPLSQEEHNRIFAFPKVEEQLIQRILNGGVDGVKALHEYTTSVSGHADKLAQYRAFVVQKQLESQMQKFYQDKIAPVVQGFTSQTEERMETEFFTQNEDLRDFRPLLIAIRNNLVQQGKSFPTKEAAFTAIATEARGYLQKANTGGIQGNAQGQQAPTTTRRMAPTSVGGQSAAGRAGSEPNLAQRFFG